jgi:PAS domain S-box-containing protein
MVDRQTTNDMMRLRPRAEKKVRRPSMDASELSHEEAIKQVNELRIHKLELEIQNEELRMAREELTAARNHYADLYDFAPVGFLSLSKDNIISEANITACRMLGLKREELLTRRLAEFVDLESQDVFHLHCREVLSTGESQSCQVGVSCPSGFFWARLDSAPDAAGLKVTMADVSQEIAVEDALRQEREKLLALINSITDEVWFCDTQGNFVLRNEAALEKIGIRTTGIVSVETILKEVEIYRPDGSRRPPEDAQPLRALKGETIRNEEEIVRIPATGELRHRQVNASPVRGGDGDIIGSVSVVRDITEREKAEQELERHRHHLQELVKERTAELQQSEENFRQSIENSPLGIRIVSAEGKTLYANRSLLDIYGCGTVDELMNTPVSERYTAESYAEHLERKAMRKQGIPVPDTYEISIMRNDGELRHLEVRRREVLWGGRTEFQSTYEDVTERKYAEERLAALSRRLLEVQEEERRNIALELHDEIGQSLNALKLMLDRLARSMDGERQSALSESSSLTGEILERVRRFSLELRPKMLDDLGLLSTLVWYFHHYTDRTGIQVDFKHTGLNREFGRELSSNVYRLVQEALTNVARHAGTDKVTVQVSIGKELLTMRIEDRGVGFDLASLPAGSSSGLEGMRERARLLGGSVTIDTSPGYGTRLLLEVPLERHLPEGMGRPVKGK